MFAKVFDTLATTFKTSSHQLANLYQYSMKIHMIKFLYLVRNKGFYSMQTHKILG